MKKLNITWDGIHDSTGYLFSLAKSLCCAVKNSPWAEYAEDIVATSGFAFRMWVAADLCPSSTSIWEFGKQPAWVTSGGLDCEYTERLWNEDAIEEKRRLAAIEQIKKSIDKNNVQRNTKPAEPKHTVEEDTSMYGTIEQPLVKEVNKENNEIRWHEVETPAGTELYLKTTIQYVGDIGAKSEDINLECAANIAVKVDIVLSFNFPTTDEAIDFASSLDANTTPAVARTPITTSAA